MENPPTRSRCRAKCRAKRRGGDLIIFLLGFYAMTTGKKSQGFVLALNDPGGVWRMRDIRVVRCCRFRFLLPHSYAMCGCSGFRSCGDFDGVGGIM
jgi:hypothetical protein